MKKLSWVILSSCLALSVSAYADEATDAAYDDGAEEMLAFDDGMPMGPMGDPGMNEERHHFGGGGGGGMMQHFRRLDLTPEQRTKLNAIHDGLRHQTWDLKGKIMDERAKLRDVLETDKPDPKKAGPIFDAMFGLKKQIILAHMDAMNRAKDVLTKDQLDELKKWKHEGHHEHR